MSCPNCDCELCIPKPSEEEMEAGLNTIRSFMGLLRKANYTFLRRATNPYKEDVEMIDIYTDDQNYEYWVDPNGSVLVQVGPSSRVHPALRKTRDTDRRSVGELRAAAVALICSQVEGFAEKRSGFHPLEDNRARLTYFFRWDDFSQPAKESELPPFVQVGLHADGTLASYTNTLRR